MIGRTAESMAVCVMVFLLLCGCSHKSKEFVNTKQDIAEEFFGSLTSSDTDISYGADDTADSKAADRHEDRSDSSESSADRIFIYVCGAVREPGVYVLPEGSRVYEAIRMAGGMTPEANEAFVNQARLLVDGEQITVYTKEETEGLDPEKYTDDIPAGVTSAAQRKININTASAEELTSLPGIGEARAEAIIEYRETNGAFRETSDIMKISGIGETLYHKIKDDIVVS